jgi:hypothetical protein
LGIFKGLRNCALQDYAGFRGQSRGLSMCVLYVGQSGEGEVQRVSKK